MVLLGTIYFDMESFGTSLHDFLVSNENRIGYYTAHYIFHQILLGIVDLYKCNILHRDIKPQNILYGPSSNRIKLIDFGSAMHMVQNSFADHPSYGGRTRSFGSPEVLLAGRNWQGFYGLKAEIWSIGVTLYLILNKGKYPFYDINLINCKMSARQTVNIIIKK